MFLNRQYKAPRGNSHRAEQMAKSTLCEAGQSTVEYILVVTAVIAVIIAMTANFKTKLNSSIETAQTGITDMSDKLARSHGGATSGGPSNPNAYPDNPDNNFDTYDKTAVKYNPDGKIWYPTGCNHVTTATIDNSEIVYDCE
jgi:Flp pilus assembly pilin Flp